MNLPSVTAIMIADGRQEMVRRAVDSFLAQTYANKNLLILGDGFDKYDCDSGVDVWPLSQFTESSLSIGRLRNLANGLTELPNIICHWDSDDWSHPNRIAEQVALLQSSGAECVGYNEMLFWDQTKCMIEVDPSRPAPGGTKGCLGTVKSVGESWLYRSTMPNYAIGTSMCYWRDTWRKHPFPDRSEGCDDLYWSTGNRVKIKGVIAITAYMDCDISMTPSMIASIHGGNTCAKIQPGAKEWRRAPEWDDYCRGVMKL